ncbi:MAG: GNAT family N-acetyltransferase [Gammaproteobacteria bacterium]
MPKFKDIDWNEFNATHREQWERLVSATAANPCHHMDWLNAVIGTQGLSGRVRVFIQMEGGRLTGGIPYYRDTQRSAGVPVRTVQTVGNCISYHQTILSEGNCAGLLNAFIEQLSDWDMLHLGNLISGDSSDHAARTATGISSRISYEGESSPFLRLTGSFDELLASKPKKFRYKFRRRPKDMDEAGSWEMRWYEGAEADLDEFIDAMFAIERNSWKVKSDMAITQRPAEEAYTRAILQVLRERKALVGNVLYLQDKPIAYSLCYHWGGLMGQMKTSYDEAYNQLSAGSLVIDAALQRAFELRAREFDFLGDSMPHKRAWSREERNHVGYYLFGEGIKARALGAMKHWINERRENSAERADSESDASESNAT